MPAAACARCGCLSDASMPAQSRVKGQHHMRHAAVRNATQLRHIRPRAGTNDSGRGPHYVTRTNGRELDRTHMSFLT
eukprot:gene15517-biopygen11238